MEKSPYFEMYDILKEPYGSEKAIEIVVTIEAIIDKNINEGKRKSKQAIKTNIYSELLVYFKNLG